jgi:hypothetical protein
MEVEDFFIRFLTRVARVKRAIYQHLESGNSVNFCKCKKLYFKRARTVHETNCIVGICIKAWGKMKELLDRANHVYMMNLFRAKAKIWAVEDHERIDEYNRVQGLREDADKYMTKFCLLAQDIYFLNQDLLDDHISIDTLTEELLLNDSLNLHINRGLPLRRRVGTFDCLPWDYFQTPYHTWIQNMHYRLTTLNTAEE